MDGDYDAEEREHTFMCPYCCNPIVIHYRVEDGFITDFQAGQMG